MGLFKKKKRSVIEFNEDSTEEFEEIRTELSEEAEENWEQESEENHSSKHKQEESTKVSAEEYAENKCNQITEARKQIKEAKLEYQAVTEYLTDIQKIDNIEDSETLKEIEDAARNIITLTRERSKYQSNDVKLTDVQFRHIARFEESMDIELKRLKDNEEYAKKIKHDLRCLDREEKMLKYQRGEIEDNHENLKKMSIMAVAFISVIALILVFLTYKNDLDMKIPFIITCVIGIAAAGFIFLETRKNHEEYSLNGRKLNKAISLGNTVKIRYVNNRNALDFAYEKFMVSSYDELLKVWQKYKSAKEEAEEYRNNTGMLHYYNTQLMKELAKAGVSDQEVWIYQAAALIDNREMVEIRHRLNERRQKLRSQIEFNYTVDAKAIENLKKMMEKTPEEKEKIEDVLKKHEIDLIQS